MRPVDSPAVLLVLTGGLLGLTFPFGKIARDAGVSPMVWAFLIAAGSATCLYPLRRLQGRSVATSAVHLRYYLLLSVVALVVPNVLILTVMTRLGAGFTGILFTLSPIITLALSSLWRLRVPGAAGLAGIVIGFIGALIVASTRGEVSAPAGFGWVLAGLCVPVSLAIGNIYRTRGWPEGADPLELAIGNNAAAALLLLIGIVVSGGPAAFVALAAVPGVALAQVVSASLMFTLFFRLQQVGGPTYLSQIGYVAAGVALLSGTVLLGERYAFVTWAGAGVIVLGIVLSIIEQRRR